MRYFLQSWQSQPSPTRKAKVMDLFNTSLSNVCVMGDALRPAAYYRFERVTPGEEGKYGTVERIYVYRLPYTKPVTYDVSWETRQYIDGAYTGVRRVAKWNRQIDFGEFVIDVLESDSYIQGTVAIDGSSCSPHSLR
jgi:hypothetical protein